MIFYDLVFDYTHTGFFNCHLCKFYTHIACGKSCTFENLVDLFLGVIGINGSSCFGFCDDGIDFLNIRHHTIDRGGGIIRRRGEDEPIQRESSVHTAEEKDGGIQNVELVCDDAAAGGNQKGNASAQAEEEAQAEESQRQTRGGFIQAVAELGDEDEHEAQESQLEGDLDGAVHGGVQVGVGSSR